jgi:hypothetical protein
MDVTRTRVQRRTKVRVLRRPDVRASPTAGSPALPVAPKCPKPSRHRTMGRSARGHAGALPASPPTNRLNGPPCPTSRQDRTDGSDAVPSRLRTYPLRRRVSVCTASAYSLEKWANARIQAGSAVNKNRLIRKSICAQFGSSTGGIGRGLPAQYGQAEIDSAAVALYHLGQEAAVLDAVGQHDVGPVAPRGEDAGVGALP